MRAIMTVVALLFSFHTMAMQENEDKTLKIHFENTDLTVKELIEELQDQKLQVIYSSDRIPMDKKLKLEHKEMKLNDILILLKKELDIDVKVNKGRIILIPPSRKYTLSGMIKDKSNGEFLTGAAIYFPELKVGTTANYYGFYSISIPEGTYTYVVSFIGMKKVKGQINLNKNIKLDFDLSPEHTALQEVVITASQDPESNTTSERISVERIKSIPTILGEPDVLKTIQLLPGVQSAHEGTNNLSVRGGSFDQNLILLDEAPVYNPSHALGIFSAINSDIVRNVEFYKGEIPARYGGRLSSVIDIKMKEGSKERLSFDGSVGLVASRLTVQSPLFNKNTSFIISGRYSYAGQLLNLISGVGANFREINQNFTSGNTVNFYDLNVKVNTEINKNNRLYISAYKGSDDFYFQVVSSRMKMKWGNQTATLRWNSILSDKIFMNSSLIYSNYDYSYRLLDDSRDFNWTAGLTELQQKTDFDFYLNPNNHIRFGYNVSSTFFEPGTITPGSRSNSRLISIDKKRAYNGSIYLSNDQNIGSRIGLYYGLRASWFVNDTDKEKAQYLNLEPRASVSYKITPNLDAKVSYVRTNQYLHMLSNSSLGLPTDIWVPSSEDLKPQKADQYSLGLFSNFDNGAYSLSAEVFLKNFHDIVDFKDNSDLFVNSDFISQVRIGEGKAKGFELLLKKNKGKLTGWLSYTYSNAERKIDGVNNDEWYPSSYDRTHSLKLIMSYKLSQSWTANMNFTYSTGSPTTVPIGRYVYQNASFLEYSKRNEYRLPDYHRLDFAFKYSNVKNKDRRWKSEWNFGLYNAYGRENVFSFFVKQEGLNQLKAYKLYLFKFMPTVTYNFKF
ncbi:MAG: TonB-dependent receptor domain-containing protein [Hyphomicrobiales bacterium]